MRPRVSLDLWLLKGVMQRLLTLFETQCTARPI